MYRGFESIDDFEKEITDQMEEQDMINDTDITWAIGQSLYNDLREVEAYLEAALEHMHHVDPEKDTDGWLDAVEHLDVVRQAHFQANALFMAHEIRSGELDYSGTSKNASHREIITALRTILANFESA